MKGSKVIINVLLVTLAYGCASVSGNKNLEKEEYIREVRSSETTVHEKTVGGITYKLFYKPADYVMLSENENSSDSVYASLVKDYEGLEYYTLEVMIKDFNDEILKYNNSSAAEYAEKVNYYSFDFQHDIYEVLGKDTVPCTSYHFERNYGISPKVRFNLAFNAANRNKERLICIHEKYLGSGTIKFTITPKDLENLPTLKLNR